MSRGRNKKKKFIRARKARTTLPTISTKVPTTVAATTKANQTHSDWEFIYHAEDQHEGEWECPTCKATQLGVHYEAMIEDCTCVETDDADPADQYYFIYHDKSDSGEGFWECQTCGVIDQDLHVHYEGPQANTCKCDVDPGA